MPRAVLMKRSWHFIKLPLTPMRIPVTESQRDTMLKQAPPRVSGKGDGFELMTFFDFRLEPYQVPSAPETTQTVLSVCHQVY